MKLKKIINILINIFLLGCLSKHSRLKELNVCKIKGRESDLFFKIIKEARDARLINFISSELYAVAKLANVTEKIKNYEGKIEEKIKSLDVKEALEVLVTKLGVNINEKREGKTALCMAICRENCHAVPNLIKILLDLGADPNIPIDESGSYPLHLAAKSVCTKWEKYNNHYKISQLLIEGGANPNLENKNKILPLHNALKSLNYKIVELLVRNMKDINSYNFLKHLISKAYEIKGSYEIDDSYFSGKSNGIMLECLELLLKNGADPNKFEETALNTAVIKAAWYNDFKVLNLLIKYGAIIKNNSSQTCMHVASEEGYAKVVEILIDMGAKLTQSEEFKFKTPLHLAVSRMALDVVKKLSNLKEGIDLRDQNGNTALHIASKKGYIDILEVILNAGADINVQNKKGDSALHIAVHKHMERKKNYEPTIDLLIKRGIKLDLKDARGYIVHNWAESNLIDLMEKIKNEKAFLVALKKKDFDLCIYLIKRGKGVRKKSLNSDSDGKKLIEIALDAKNYNFVATLLTYGADPINYFTKYSEDLMPFLFREMDNKWDGLSELHPNLRTIIQSKYEEHIKLKKEHIELENEAFEVVYDFIRWHPWGSRLNSEELHNLSNSQVFQTVRALMKDIISMERVGKLPDVRKSILQIASQAVFPKLEATREQLKLGADIFLTYPEIKDIMNKYLDNLALERLQQMLKQGSERYSDFKEDKLGKEAEEIVKTFIEQQAYASSLSFAQEYKLKSLMKDIISLGRVGALAAVRSGVLQMVVGTIAPTLAAAIGTLAPIIEILLAYPEVKSVIDKHLDDLEQERLQQMLKQASKVKEENASEVKNEKKIEEDDEDEDPYLNAKIAKLRQKLNNLKGEVLEREGAPKGATGFKASHNEGKGIQVDKAIERNTTYDHRTKVVNAQQGFLKCKLKALELKKGPKVSKRQHWELQNIISEADYYIKECIKSLHVKE